jgi:hypothetical protein
LEIPSFDSSQPEKIFTTSAGFLVHILGSRILRCVNLSKSIPGTGNVTQMEFFISAAGRECVAVLTERSLVVFELSDDGRRSFVLRRQESVDAVAEIMTFDFLGRGSQQLFLQVYIPWPIVI